VYQGEER